MNSYLIKIFIFFVSMTFPTENDFIGKHISKFPSAALGSDHGYKKDYRIVGDFAYLGKPYEILFLFTDKNDIVQSYDILFEGDIDRAFYNLMIKKYGNPDSIVNIKNISESATSIDENGISAKQFIGKLMECSFDENPFLIKWIENKIEIRFDLKKPDAPFKKTIIHFGN
ncbi:hypothetical protein [Aquimarina rubra]|uniref:Uncharacterized protein n=1 Tax=Aquimarina rubra TaxID=1920033 RepID=A0ABW5LE55_9FLAO